MNYIYKKKKKRDREIDFCYVERLKEEMGFTWGEVAQLMGFETTAQIYNYKHCGKANAKRYYAARDALLLHVEEKAREEREKIMRLFNATH